MDVRIVAPRQLWPDDALAARARRLAERSGARVALTEDITDGVRGADYVNTQRVPPAGLRPGSTSPAVVREFSRSLHGSKRCRLELWPQGHSTRQQCVLSKRPMTRSMDRRMPLIPG